MHPNIMAAAAAAGTHDMLRRAEAGRRSTRLATTAVGARAASHGGSVAPAHGLPRSVRGLRRAHHPAC